MTHEEYEPTRKDLDALESAYKGINELFDADVHPCLFQPEDWTHISNAKLSLAYYFGLHCKTENKETQ